MSGSRSKNGCWTCRLRRKKCDEAHPICHACAFRQLTCHGYGPQPTWMDGGQGEEIELAKIKQVVGQSYRARRKIRANQPVKSIGPCDTENSESSNARQETQEGVWQPGVGNSGLVKDTLQPGHLKLFRGGLPTRSTVWLPGPRDISHDQEVGKIVYFFNRVFPTQHPFHGNNPAAPSAEQQWLQAVIGDTNHYRLSVLTISALYRNVLVHNDNTTAEQGMRSLSEFLEYHSLTVNALQDQLSILYTLIGPMQRKVELELLASMIQLVSVEVIRESKPFQGDIGNWDIHLDGAQALLDRVYTSSNNTSVREGSSGLLVESAPYFSAWNPNIVSVTDELQPFGVVGLKFLTAIFAWADICRCASIGWHYSTCQEYPYKRYIDKGRICLRSVMGCSNAVMSCIMDITQLEAWKNEGVRHGSDQIVDGCRRRGAAIHQRLIGELKNQPLISSCLSLEDRDKTLITWAYGICALIYLHIIVANAGPCDPTIQEYIKHAITVFQAMSPHRLRSVSWPFCVAGCMAIQKERNAFRHIFKSASGVRSSPGTLWSGFAVVERSWEQRLSSQDWSEKGAMCWRKAMDSLGVKVLLI